MFEDRLIKYPAWVLALLLGILALSDAMNAMTLKQAPDAGWGWLVDMLTAAVCTVFVTLLLLKPHWFWFAGVAIWSFVGWCANGIMTADTLDTQRMVLYFVAFVMAVVVTGIEIGQLYPAWSAKRAARAAAAWQQMAPPGWVPGAPMPGAYPPGYPAGYPQAAAPAMPAAPMAPPPPAAPVAPPAPPKK